MKECEKIPEERVKVTDEDLFGFYDEYAFMEPSKKSEYYKYLVKDIDEEEYDDISVEYLHDFLVYCFEVVPLYIVKTIKEDEEKKSDIYSLNSILMKARQKNFSLTSKELNKFYKRDLGTDYEFYRENIFYHLSPLREEVQRYNLKINDSDIFNALQFSLLEYLFTDDCNYEIKEIELEPDGLLDKIFAKIFGPRTKKEYKSNVNIATNKRWDVFKEHLDKYLAKENLKIDKMLISYFFEYVKDSNKDRFGRYFSKPEDKIYFNTKRRESSFPDESTTYSEVEVRDFDKPLLLTLNEKAYSVCVLDIGLKVSKIKQ